MEENYSMEIAERIQSNLEKLDLHFHFDEKRGVIEFDLVLRGILERVRYTMEIRACDFTVYVVSPISADENDTKMMIHMAKFFSMANYGLRIGNFEFDMGDGEIRYKIFVDCEDMEVSDEAIRKSIHVPAIMYERYSKGFLKIIFNKMSAEEAIYLCEEQKTLSDTEETEQDEEETEEDESAMVDEDKWEDGIDDSAIIDFLRNVKDKDEE